MTTGSTLPAGYERVHAGRCEVVTLQHHAADARALLAEGTLHHAAARDLAARPLHGRDIAYAIALPVTHVHAVVRHNRHGGLFAPLTRDLFLPPTRAPLELETSLRLAGLGIATPEVLMYGVEWVGPFLCRSDVVTREVEESRDLSAMLAPSESEAKRGAAWMAAAALLRSLRAAGVRHHDLNVKNILLSGEGSAMTATMLDVDRVTFHAPNDPAVHRRNVARLVRSAIKWRDDYGAVVDEASVARMLA